MRKISIFIIALLLIFFCSSAHSLNDKGLRVHFLDVGKGDSILVETPKGRAVLVDAGNLITGYKVAEYLKKKGIRKLDYLIFTHHDLDHIGGSFFIMQMLEVEMVYDNGQDLGGIPAKSDAYGWYNSLVRSRDNYSILKEGSSFQLDGVGFKCLSSYAPSLFSGFNENSIIIMVGYRGFKCLLTGDATILTERELLEKDKNLRADVLKVGHHGDNDASSIDFLKAVLPKAAVISVDRGNPTGKPAKEVIDRLKALNSRIYRTDRDGDIIVDVDREGRFKITCTQE